MDILICIDDTDDKSKVENTEKVAIYIQKNIKYNGYGSCEEIKKNQLFINDNISYTFKNIAVSFKANIKDEYYSDVIKDSIDIIKENMSPKSNPGLCVLREKAIKNINELIEFGLKVQVEKVSIKEAYDLAEKSNVYLRGYGESKNGVIGALGGACITLNK